MGQLHDDLFLWPFSVRLEEKCGGIHWHWFWAVPSGVRVKTMSIMFLIPHDDLERLDCMKNGCWVFLMEVKSTTRIHNMGLKKSPNWPSCRARNAFIGPKLKSRGETIEQWEGYSVLDWLWSSSCSMQVQTHKLWHKSLVFVCGYIYINLMNVFKAHCTKAMSVYVATFGWY